MESEQSREGTESVRFTVPSMDCASCADTVEGALSTVDGVQSVEPAPAAGRVSVEYDPGVQDRPGLVETIEAAGYEVVDEDVAPEMAASDIWLSTRAVKTWVSAGLLIVGLVVAFGFPSLNPELGSLLGHTVTLSHLVFLGATVVGGEVILRGGVRSTRQLSLDMDFLMSVAILGAVSASLFFGEDLYF
jgi:Cd2+/Zn2+-exporting ATPase